MFSRERLSFFILNNLSNNSSKFRVMKVTLQSRIIIPFSN